MPRKRLLIILAVAGVGAAPFAYAAVTTTSTPDRYACTTDGPSRTLVRTVGGRVYAVDAGTSGDYRRQKVYACNAATGRTFYLGLDLSGLSDDTSPTFLRRIMAPDLSRGTVGTVAWVVSVTGTGSSPTRNEIRQMSLGSGRVVRTVSVGSAFVRPLLAYNGYLAWIDQAPNGSCTPTCTVHVFNRQGDRVIDSGSDIESDSLARDAGDAVGASSTVGSQARIFWIKGGTAKTATYS